MSTIEAPIPARLLWRPTWGDHPDFAHVPLQAPEGIEDLRFARERALLRIAKRETGNPARPDAQAKREGDSLELLEQSRELRRRLLAVGREMYRESPFSTYQVFLHSGQIIRQPQFRRCMLIPWMAKQVRAPMLSAVEAWLYQHPYARMWTITSGFRVRLGERGTTLRARLRHFHARLGRLAAFIRRYGLELVFRSTELGGIETDRHGRSVAGAGEIEIDRTTGAPNFHVHAHCLVWSRVGYIQPRRWEAILAAVWRYWGHQWADNGVVRDGREVVKYVTKPGEMLRLRPEHLRDLADALRRIRMVAPMGDLKESIARRRARSQRIDWQPTPEGRVPVDVPDWNRHGPKHDAERELDRLLRFGRRGEQSRTPDFRILARCAPSCAPGQLIKEPTVTVLCAAAPDLEAIRRHPLVAPLYAATRAHWEAGLAAGALLKVHTCTSTPTPGLPPDPPGRAAVAETARK